MEGNIVYLVGRVERGLGRAGVVVVGGGVVVGVAVVDV